MCLNFIKECNVLYLIYCTYIPSEEMNLLEIYKKVVIYYKRMIKKIAEIICGRVPLRTLEDLDPCWGIQIILSN